MQACQIEKIGSLSANDGHRNKIVPSQVIEDFIAAKIIDSQQKITANQIQPASLDLRLGKIAYRVRGGFLTGKNSTVMERVSQLKMHEISLDGEAGILEKGAVYIIPLQESLNLPEGILGTASPKSSTGRLDILTRLITDNGTQFDKVCDGYQGKLYLEVTPLTFSIIAREGDTLNQLRLREGNPVLSDSELQELNKEVPLLYINEKTPEAGEISNGLWMSVDLEGKSEDGIVGYRARKNAPLVDLRKIAHYALEEFWEPIYRPKSGYIILDPEAFYIMASREKIKIPIEYSAEMVAYDTSAGELRVHYAGFFDPAFGCGADNELNGMTAVLEIRSHDVPFVLEHGQKICRMVYEHVAEVPEKLYGVNVKSNYANQKLKLAKQFRMV